MINCDIIILTKIKEFEMDNKNLINISKKSFFSVLIILVSLMVVAFLLTYLIPQGNYLRDVSDNIIPGSFTFLTGERLPIYKFFIAPIEIFASSDGITVIMICIFLVVLGGFFTVMEKTNGITVIIKKLIVRYQNQKYLLLM